MKNIYLRERIKTLVYNQTKFTDQLSAGRHRDRQYSRSTLLDDLAIPPGELQKELEILRQEGILSYPVPLADTLQFRGSFFTDAVEED